ncbi:unnamed protein product [Zymoseptoria tritici ST99CH_1A5]|uniref:Uncharacterized protein n=1 Tax=Zymoseptoria tritici ST99CH_1A5 TaxID=1276529 RepID=A0A1Y6LYD3_ZYMTR|nr:unnamed protein product [Zymoseptoria tritici ST99CH_1A5]
MTSGPLSAAISSLNDASATTEQKLQAAKKLKSLIVGQDQRKELAVNEGVVQPLANILSAATKSTGKRNLDARGARNSQNEQWSIEDDLTLQAALIIGRLAAGGSIFFPPLCAADVPKTLVEALSAGLGPRLVNAILQALKELASSASTTDDSPVDFDFWSTIINVQSLAVLDGILKQDTSSSDGAQQLRLVTDIISVLPDSRPSPNGIKALVVNCGVLDTLAALMVSHTIKASIVRPNRDFPKLPPAPPEICLPSIIAAISTVITGSNYRAHRFILATPIYELFMHSGLDGSDSRASFDAKHGFQNPDISLLPPLHIPTTRTVSHNPGSGNFPALQTLQSVKYGKNPSDTTPLVSDIDHSNSVCGWLLVLIRSLHGLNRINALRLLALVANAIEQDPAGAAHKSEFQQKTKERQRQLCLLAVPLAVQIVKDVNEGQLPTNLQESRALKEQACAVLALLITCHRDLQAAAVEADAIKQVCPILKKSFDNVTLAKPMWSARSKVDEPTDAPATCRMGKVVFPPEIYHAMRCRQGALKALEAIAAKEDVHRKAIIESGVVSCIIDSLKPFIPNAASNALDNRVPITPKDGNTVAVILAACHAARSMSRSVSVLRTSLIDGGIAKPLMQLLSHPSLEVQVAATDVCCNLVTDFSPMREELSQTGVVRTLCEHARSNSPALRLSSLWALKHLVFASPKDLKFATLEELGTGFLVGIIQGEQREGPSNGGGVSVNLSTPNAAGEQVDILNPSSMDVDEPIVDTPEEPMDEDEDDDEAGNDDGDMIFDEQSRTYYQSSQMRSTLDLPAPAFSSKRYLSSMRELEQDEEYLSRRDEAATQQQALDFIRNFINGEDCAVFSDHIMNTIGSAQVYDLLTAKLAPLPSRSTTTTTRPLHNPTELILSTVHVIIHLANASPRHRQMLIAQKPLLSALLPHFHHPDPRVRVMCVWAINSLTWIEEEGDRREAKQRSNELKAMGFEQAVKSLKDDPVLDFGVRPAEEEDEMAGFEIVSFSELQTPERVERERAEWERMEWERRMMEGRWADRQEREREITREAGLRSEWWRMHGGGADPGGPGGSGSGSGN